MGRKCMIEDGMSLTVRLPKNLVKQLRRAGEGSVSLGILRAASWVSTPAAEVVIPPPVPEESELSGEEL